MADHAERHELSRRAKRAKVEEQIRDGSLVICTATPEERVMWSAGGPTRSAPGTADPPDVPPAPDSNARALLATAEDGDV
jgi:hypothetical protein